MTIDVLNPDTIGKIAAGEVVERPVSVVKELLENALDAGATRIQISISAGGGSSIEVSDNGSGIPANELTAALSRHATSKLKRFDDLDSLATLGFRGEALPSIAAVSRFRLQSRPEIADSAAALFVEFGRATSIESAGADVGTTVTVLDLFGNLPARRKFQRQPSTEAGIIVRTVGAYATAYPDVSMSLIVDGRRVFSTTGNGNLIETATAVLGPEVGMAAVLIEPCDDGSAVPDVTVTGWLCRPALNRSHRHSIVFFLNGRLIQSRSLGYALEEAYHTLQMVGRHPVSMIRIEVDPSRVDVNVHPTKAEVRFVDERAIARAVSRAAHRTLLKMPQSEAPVIRIDSFAVPSHVQPAAAISTAQVPTGSHEMVARRSLDSDSPPSKPQMPLLRVLGQVASTYIIAEGPEGLYLIDQHAAHERVLYERFLSQLASSAVDTQPMLDPLVVDLSVDELAVAERSLDELRQLGFDVEFFGQSALIVRSVPTSAIGSDIPERLRLILGELGDGGAGSTWLDSVTVSVACHTSIRAGQVLSIQEMRELIAQLERTDQPRACGHGRPTMLRLTQSELERQFGR
jgi:DNA mismatch repair protein MutL